MTFLSQTGSCLKLPPRNDSLVGVGDRHLRRCWGSFDDVSVVRALPHHVAIVVANVSDLRQDHVFCIDDEELVREGRVRDAGNVVEGEADGATGCGWADEGRISLDGSGERCLHL